MSEFEQAKSVIVSPFMDFWKAINDHALVNGHGEFGFRKALNLWADCQDSIKQQWIKEKQEQLHCDGDTFAEAMKVNKNAETEEDEIQRKISEASASVRFRNEPGAGSYDIWTSLPSRHKAEFPNREPIDTNSVSEQMPMTSNEIPNEVAIKDLDAKINDQYKFEKWAKDNDYLTKSIGNEYINGNTRWAWNAWQAALASRHPNPYD